MSGAVDIQECRTRRGLLCRCVPVCVVCGYGPHVALYGPLYGQAPGSKPFDHEYTTEATK